MRLALLALTTLVAAAQNAPTSATNAADMSFYFFRERKRKRKKEKTISSTIREVCHGNLPFYPTHTRQIYKTVIFVFGIAFKFRF